MCFNRKSPSDFWFYFLAFLFGWGSYLPSELLGALRKGSPSSAEDNCLPLRLGYATFASYSFLYSTSDL